LRWKRPHGDDERLTGAENYDVPPTDPEKAHALAMLEDVLTTEDAKKLAGRLYIQFYNEVGGGPGKFTSDQLDDMLDFATDATQMIREKAPHVKICGPAITMGQVLNRELQDDPRFREQAEIILSCLEWTARHADAIDLHLHAMDGSNARTAIRDLRVMMSEYPGGDELDMVAFEWSPARFANREDGPQVRNAMLGIWQAMAEGGIQHAAYGSYWATDERREAGVNEIFLWKSIVDESGRPREPIYSTLDDIGHDRIAVDPPSGDGDDDDDQGDDGSGDSDDDQRYASGDVQLWINGAPKDPEIAQQLGAAGVRDVIDLRTASNKVLRSTIKAYRKSELGVVMTVRWSDPNQPDAYDLAPEPRDQSKMHTQLRNAMKSKQARDVAGSADLWLQFFDEVAGSHGRIRHADEQALYAFATDMVDTIRSTAPHVSICGPAITETHLLSASSRDDDEQDRYDRLVTAIQWSIQHADAIDVRASIGESTATAASRLRDFLATQQGGAGLEIVSWSWNGSSSASQGDDEESTQESVTSAWQEIEASEIQAAAYGPLRTDEDQDATNDDHALLDESNTHLAAAESFSQIAMALGQLVEEQEPEETESQRRKRMNAFRNDYKAELKDQFKASGDKDWKKQWNAAWKANWEAAWEEHEFQRHQ
jgi:hypothetical protein